TAAGEDVRFSSLAFVPSQLLVLELRSLLDGPQDVEPRKFEVTYYDRLGKTLRTFENEVAAKASYFEGVAGPKNEKFMVSEAFDVLVAPPANARYVGVSAGRPMIVRGFVETGFEPEEIDAYPIVEPPAVWRLRQVPRPGWARVEPANRGVLAAQDRISKVVGQTRIELLDDPDEATTDWRSAPVRGAAQEEIILGEVFPAETEAAVSDNRALRLSCAPGAKAKVSLIPDPSAENLGILDVTYYVPSSLELGGLIGVEQEGRVVAKIVPVTRLDSVRVRKVRRQADLLWKHEFKGGDPRVFVRIAPGRGRPYAPPAGCRAYRSFTVTRLPPGGAVNLAVDADPQDPRAVNIVAYGTKADSLVALIDQGRLRRAGEPRVGRPTRATQELALTWRPRAASSFLLTRPDEPLHTSLTAFVQLGADLSKGAHTLTLRNKGAREVWFRAFQAARAPQKKASVEVKRLQ
ncbi:MAG: hypothetical protein MUC50_04870, partial [Myxococcota bacterium]|nr:hypothetical protein [Myxococcota bacterium]